MVSAASLSIISSPSSPFESPYFNKFTRKIPRISSTNLIKFRPITQSLSIEEDAGSPDRFLENNSIADYMRFKKGASGELQTAVVSYRKKFPWSLLQPFLQVNNFFNCFPVPRDLVCFRCFNFEFCLIFV